MFDQTIRQLLAMFPRGATDDQLVWRLAASGIRISASEILCGLNNLVERGEVAREPTGRWKAITTAASAEDAKKARGQDGADPPLQGVLYAVAGLCRARDKREPSLVPDAAGPALPEWTALLTYYAATQRKDPRGRIQEFADRHGTAWQLIRTIGSWWSDASIHVAMDDLPERFRESIVRRNTSSAAIGWPISIFPAAAGVSYIPALILPVEFRVQDQTLVLEIEATTPSLNPSWLREVRRHVAISEDELADRLFPEDEEADLGAVGARMRHLLASIGGGSLRPADLAGELSQAGKGLKNAAGLFLPEDASFTRGAAEDLENMRNWSAEQRKGTSLEALFSASKEESLADDVSVLPTSVDDPLTESQLDAASSALRGPLTVIQGPPGTGKSQVILALIVSAVLAGRSVLFAAKNHQAIDEVERRLSELVPNSSLLTRGRDAEGERDSSLLDALSELSRGETRKIDFDSSELALKTILDNAQRHSQRRRERRDLEALHVAMSELSDRLDASKEKWEPNRRDRLAIALRRTVASLRRLLGQADQPTAPLPETATTRQIKLRLAELRRQLESRASSDGLQTESETDAAELVSLEEDIVSDLSKIADNITLPDQAEWTNLVDRAREIEFARLSARRMAPEDARAVLRHRPVWAVSTLATPARIPLAPSLFDYVIFDEASQCDIASALPLFARARKAIVVGDPMQLRFVPSLGNASEHALMDAAGLPQTGRAAIAQSINSLFDFCNGRPNAARNFLADQFRSAPPIVDYLNADFYSGRLVGRRAEKSFKPPTGYRAGLAWEDILGQAIREGGGTINKAEADQIAYLVHRLAIDASFSGSVGVISPFNAQVAEIQKRLATTLSQEQRERLSLRVTTVDKFQGGEADVILFSLVLSASAPKSAWTFLQKERRRLNVAVSRARALCTIVGDLAYARSCGIRHIEFLAERATTPWTPYRPRGFDSDWERRLDAAMRRRGLNPIP